MVHSRGVQEGAPGKYERDVAENGGEAFELWVELIENASAVGRSCARVVGISVHEGCDARERHAREHDLAQIIHQCVAGRDV